MLGETFFLIIFNVLCAILLLISRNEAVVFMSQDILCSDTKTPIASYNDSYYRKCISQCVMEQCCLGILEETNTCKLFGQKPVPTLTTNVLIDNFRVCRLKTLMGIGNASQISDYSSGYIANYAVDGSLSTVAVTNTAINPWWSVDLAKSYFILTLGFQLRFPSRFSSLTLYLSNSPIIIGQYNGVPVFATFSGPNSASFVNVTPSSGAYGMWGRYLTLQRNITNDVMDLTEVTFYVAEPNEMEIDF